jgi:signal transduction histidine kinase
MPSPAVPSSTKIIQMDYELRNALDRLRADTESVRLAAARVLQKRAAELSPQAEHEVREAFATETVPWVRGALAEILAVGSPPIGQGMTIPAPRWDSQVEGANPEVARQAINISTRRVLHEVAAVVGRARVAAGEDLGEAYLGSETYRQLTYLSELCGGLRTLANATVHPTLEEFDLRDELLQLAKSIEADLVVEIRVEGPKDFMVQGDKSLLGLAVRNLLVNAVEATQSLKAADDRVVLMTWGVAQEGVHISVIDRGPGPAAFLAQASRAGLSTKVGHSGYGLATASEAVRGLEGEVRISRNDRGGATAVIVWPGTR